MLRKSVQGTALDFSQIFAVARSLNATLTKEYKPFRLVALSIQDLSSTVTLSSGHGLVEIWSRFLDGDQVQAYQQISHVLDTANSGPLYNENAAGTWNMAHLDLPDSPSSLRPTEDCLQYRFSLHSAKSEGCKRGLEPV